MDTRQATERVQTHITDTVAQLPPTARLTPRGGTDSLPCDAPDDGGPEGRVIVEYEYEVQGLSGSDYEWYFDTVRRHWEQCGYRRLRLDADSARYREMVYADPDGFRLVLSANLVDERLFILSQSPCVWPSGAPD